MSRRLPLALLAVVVALAAAVMVISSGDGEERASFDVVFDNARGMVPGQLVKFAGARVGTIDDIVLTKNRKAAFRVSVKAENGPIYNDATCKILPEGFISESFVQCDPGTAATGPLRADAASGRPTVPVERTEVSVQLQQVIDTFTLPVDERIRVVLTELGIMGAGTAHDLNDVLRRANPALKQTKAALETVSGQRDELQRAIGSTDTVLTELARRKQDLRGFVADTATAARIADTNRTQLAASVRSAPGLLREAKVGLRSLETMSRELRPTAAKLRVAAPDVTRLVRAVEPTSRLGVPALDALVPAARKTRQAIVPTRPILQDLTGFTRRVARPAKLADDLLVSLRDTGGIESLLDFVYTLATVSGTFDAVSHFIPITLGVNIRCWVAPLDRGCNHNFFAEDKGHIPVNDPTWKGSTDPTDGSHEPQSERDAKLAARAAAGLPDTPAAKTAASGSTPGLDGLTEQTKKELGVLLNRLVGQR